MNTPYVFPEGPKIVYVREVAVRDLPDALREQAGDLDVIWSVHAPDGQQLALVANKALAFHLARQHDVTPVSVH
jgi:hypothetical protein